MKPLRHSMRARLGLLALVLGFAPITVAGNLSQQQLTRFAAETNLNFSVVTNFAAKAQVELRLANASSIALPAGPGDWKIYFHSIRKIDGITAQGLQLKHVQGDLHEIAPTDDFKGLATGASLGITYAASSANVSYTDFMPRAFIAQPGLQPAVFANTDTEDIAQFVAPFSKPEQQLRSSDDLYQVVTAAARFEANLAVNQVAAKLDHSPKIIPTPANITYRKGTARLDGNWKIHFAGQLASETRYLAEQLKSYGLEIPSVPNHESLQGKVIELAVDKALQNPEAYRLTISAEKVLVAGGDNAGVFYGIQSLLSLLPAQTAASYDIPQLTVDDRPRFSWRGMHYDMGRNFHGKEYTLRLIEQMARYKLNKLHLHLTEDEGWRLEIPGLQELTDIGAQRCFDLQEQACLLTQLGTGPHKTGSGNGFYSTEDFIEILKFASARHIEVIPEIDMPGHARAAIKSMEARYKRLMKDGKKAEAERYLLSDPLDKSRYISIQNYTDNAINVCLPSTYAFAEKVIYELQQMYRKAGARLATFHMGGDEVGPGAWTVSPACEDLFAKGEEGVAGVADLKPYFVKKLAQMTHARGLALAGWEDGLMYDPLNTFNRAQFPNQHVLANAWDNIWEWGVADRAYRLANAGYEPILSPATHLYFDHPYEAHPEERGYYWATRYTDTAKVFGFMPDNFYANADRTRMGAPIENLEAMVGRALPALEKPENLRGLQGQVWSETIRTGAQMEQMIYPRLISLAERAWYKAPWEADKPDAAARQRDCAQHAAQLGQKELPKLARLGSDFYLPPPGAIVKAERLQANAALPGLDIEYSTDKGTSWQPYVSEVPIEKQPVMLRTRLGNKTSRIAIAQ